MNTKTIIILGITLAGMLLGSILLMSSCNTIQEEELESKTQHITVHSNKSIIVKNADASHDYIHIVTIDGQEYLIASTYHGVGICKK